MQHERVHEVLCEGPHDLHVPVHPVRRGAGCQIRDFEHDPVEVGVDNKGAYDLCHRATAGKNSRHVERKVFKMRELQHAGKVKLVLVPTNEMRADMFTKPLDLDTFVQHRDRVMNTAAVAARAYRTPSQ